MRAELSPLWFLPTRAAAAVLAVLLRRGGRPRRAAARALATLRSGDRPPTYRTIFVLDL